MSRRVTTTGGTGGNQSCLISLASTTHQFLRTTHHNHRPGLLVSIWVVLLTFIPTLLSVQTVVSSSICRSHTHLLLLFRSSTRRLLHRPQPQAHLLFSSFHVSSAIKFTRSSSKDVASSSMRESSNSSLDTLDTRRSVPGDFHHGCVPANSFSSKQWLRYTAMRSARDISMSCLAGRNHLISFSLCTESATWT